MLAKLRVDQALMKARSHAKKDEIAEAQKLYQTVLLSFPKNIRAKQGLAALNKYIQNNAVHSPSQEIVDYLINLCNQGQFSAVIKQTRALTAQYPQTFIVWSIMGVASSQIGLLDDAIIAFQKVISLEPNDAKAHYNIGNTFQKQGKWQEAIDAYNKALLIKPEYAEAYNNMGVALKEQGKLDEAIKAYNKTVLIKSDYADAYYNMGNALNDYGKWDEAIDAYNKSISLKPDYADAYNSMGHTLQEQGKWQESIEACNKALSIKPECAEAHFNLSFALLNSGNLKDGLNEYEWRKIYSKSLSQQRYFLQPLWDGKESLNGKRILLWSEQGIGDTINWSSCLSLVNSQAKHCILECQEKLVPLLKRSFPEVEVKPSNRNLDSKRDDFDFHLPMGSLYKHFINEIEENARADTYLIPDPIRVGFWKKRLK